MRLRLLGTAALCAAAALPVAANQSKQPRVSAKENEALMQVQSAAQAGNFAGELTAITNVLENFADTKFKPQLLDMAMDAAQRTNDPVQVATWYERAIANDPNDIPARVIYAEVTAGHIRENDLDKATSVKKVNDLAHKALDLIQSGGTAPVAVQADQAEGYKKELSGRAWTAIAMADSVDKRPADAVADYKKGFDLFPNSIVAARLAKAYVDNKQYDDAIAMADKSMGMADASPQVKAFAQQQKDIATKLKGAK
jgi:tetratricopeptide (TPR) repeat protein